MARRDAAQQSASAALSFENLLKYMEREKGIRTFQRPAWKLALAGPDLLIISQQVCRRSLAVQPALNLWFTDACGPVPIKIGHSNPVLDPCAGLGLRFGSNRGISMEYIGPAVLAQQAVLLWVLAQVTKLEPAFLKGPLPKSRVLN
jgi:hypothetical protein